MNALEYYVTCPFNSSHRILKHKLPKHLYRCCKQYPNQKITCPYDASHMINPQEHKQHLSECISSGNIKCYQNILEPKQDVGTISLEEACNRQTAVINEDWSGNNETYDAIAASEDKTIIRAAVGLTKAEKKLFKQQERNRILSLEKTKCNKSAKDTIPESKTDFEKPLRIPKNVAKAISFNQSQSISDFSFELEKLSV